MGVRSDQPIKNGALMAGVAAWALAATPLHAQAVQPQASPPQGDNAELNPDAPLEPLPDLGVDWPDLAVPDEPPPTEQGIEGNTAEQAIEESAQHVEDIAAVQRYRWTISGIDNVEDSEAIRHGFEERSTLQTERKDAANAAQIDRRARADAELLTELLRSHGYYDAVVDPRISASEAGVAVDLAAEPGARYHFDSVTLPGLDEAAGDQAEALRNAFAVKDGDPVEAQKVIDAGIALQVALGERGFATAKVGEQDIVIDHDTHLARLTLPVTPGPVAKFGKISVSGKPAFSAKHVGVIARFKEGDRYQKSDVTDLRKALIATGLVSAVDVEPVPREGGEIVDLAVKLEPAPVHTIAGELGYGTGEGFRAEASWQHRNFFNPEGALTLRGVVGTQEQLAAITVRRNNWLQRDQVLNLQASADHINRSAYQARTVSLSAGFERQSNFIWHKKWTWSLGVEILASDERDTIQATGEPRQRTFFIGAIPASLGYDGSDDLLNPTRGFRLLGRVSPEISFENGTFTYARAQFDASGYHPISDSIVAAGRLRFGTIIGASRDDIAPTRRFYAGGGGSVRGYGYQQLGPRDVDGNPVGGRSLAEFSLEARIRLKAFGGNFGIVPFFDGGTLSTEFKPDFKHWQFGTGIGVRYYSSFGPIRVDVGTPLNRQQGDGRIAVVVSLGQAF